MYKNKTNVNKTLLFSFLITGLIASANFSNDNILIENKPSEEETNLIVQEVEPEREDVEDNERILTEDAKLLEEPINEESIVQETEKKEEPIIQQTKEEPVKEIIEKPVHKSIKKSTKKSVKRTTLAKVSEKKKEEIKEVPKVQEQIKEETKVSEKKEPVAQETEKKEEPKVVVQEEIKKEVKKNNNSSIIKYTIAGIFTLLLIAILYILKKMFKDEENYDEVKLQYDYDFDYILNEETKEEPKMEINKSSYTVFKMPDVEFSEEPKYMGQNIVEEEFDEVQIEESIKELDILDEEVISENIEEKEETPVIEEVVKMDIPIEEELDEVQIEESIKELDILDEEAISENIEEEKEDTIISSVLEEVIKTDVSVEKVKEEVVEENYYVKYNSKEVNEFEVFDRNSTSKPISNNVILELQKERLENEKQAVTETKEETLKDVLRSAIVIKSPISKKDKEEKRDNLVTFKIINGKLDMQI